MLASVKCKNAIETAGLKTKSSNFEPLNRDILNSTKIICIKQLQDIKEVSISDESEYKFEQVNKNYTQDCSHEIKRVINNTSTEGMKSYDLDTVADTTFLSRYSESMPSMDSINSEEILIQKLEELKRKTVESQRKVEDLSARNKHIKNKIVNRTKDRHACSTLKTTRQDPMDAIVSKLTLEIEEYNNWVGNYRKQSTLLFNTIYSKLVNQLNSFFNSEVAIARSGSFDNGLLMPWSDLNMVVTFNRGNKSETRSRTVIMESIQKFSKILTIKNKLVDKFVIEERSSLVILKLSMAQQYRSCAVEIIFKYSGHSSFPNNEEVSEVYLRRYPVIKPLYTVFRSMLHKSTLDNPLLNGLKSVTIVLMITAYLQQLELNDSLTKDISIGQLFLNFLFHYSYSFDYYAESIQCTLARRVKTSPFVYKNPDRQINALEICSPYNAEIILTKSFKRTGELKQLIKLCYISVFDACGCPLNKTVAISPNNNSDTTEQSALYNCATKKLTAGLEQFDYVSVEYNAQRPKKFIKRPLKKPATGYEAKCRPVTELIVSTTSLNFERELSLVKPQHKNEVRLFMLYGLLNFRFEHFYK